MAVAASVPDPAAITTTWEEHHEARILALQAKYAAAAGDQRHVLRGGVPAAVRRAAAALGVDVIDYRPGAIGAATVRCPHCGGGRSVSSSNLRKWEVRGAVPACGPCCRPLTKEGEVHG